MEQQGGMENELDGYLILKRMGEGAQGRIFLVREKPEDGVGRRKEWVMKMVSLPSKHPQAQQYEDAIREGSTMQYLHHPCVVSCKESFVHAQQTLCIVMEHCKGGDLCTRIRQQAELGKNFPEGQITDWLVHTLLALEYLHEQRILHRDIKSENIFLHQPINGGPQIVTAQLGDFGIARVLDSSDALASTFVGTPYYMSPELFQGRPYNCKTDIWALGCVLYELLCLRQPFRAKNFPELAKEVTRGFYAPIQSSYSSNIRNVVARMLTLDPTQRPLAADLLELPFLRDRAQSFFAAHVSSGSFSKLRSPSGRSFTQIDIHHSLRDQARRLHLIQRPSLHESGTETSTDVSTDNSPTRERYAAEAQISETPDLFMRGGSAPFLPTPRFPKQGLRDSPGWSTPSPPLQQRPHQTRPGVLSDPPPARASKLYRPIPIRAMPCYPEKVRFDRNDAYPEGPGPPLSDWAMKNPKGWSLLHRPPGGAESALAPYARNGQLRTATSEPFAGVKYGDQESSEMNPARWEGNGMDYYGDGVNGDPRDLREMRDARVKRREVTAAFRARKSPRSPDQANLAEAFEREMGVGDDTAEDEELVRVFHVDTTSSSPELNEDGYEVIGSSPPTPPEFDSPCGSPLQGAASDTAFGADLWPSDLNLDAEKSNRTAADVRQAAPNYQSEGPSSAFSIYRRPPFVWGGAYQPPHPIDAAHFVHHQKAARYPQPQQPRIADASPRRLHRKLVNDSAPLSHSTHATPHFKSPSPPVGPPPRSARPVASVRSRRVVHSADPGFAVPSTSGSTAVHGRNPRAYTSDATQSANRVTGGSFQARGVDSWRAELGEIRPISSSSASPDLTVDGRDSPAIASDPRDSNGSSNGQDSNGSSGANRSEEARSGSSSGVRQGSLSGMSGKHSSSPPFAEERGRRVNRGVREPSPPEGSSGNSEYAPSGSKLRQSGEGFVFPDRRHHSDGAHVAALAHSEGHRSEGGSYTERSVLAQWGAWEGGDSERGRFGSASRREPTPPSPRNKMSEGASELAARTGHFVRRAHVQTRCEDRPAALNRAPVSDGAQPNGWLSPPRAIPQAVQSRVAYYSDGGDDLNEPTTSAQLAADERRKKAGLRPRAGPEYPMCTDRSDGRARFEYDYAHMQDEFVRDRRHVVSPGVYGKPGVSSQVYAKETSAYQAPLLTSEALQGRRRSMLVDAAGVEWWRLPPVTAPLGGSLLPPNQRTSMVS